MEKEIRSVASNIAVKAALSVRYKSGCTAGSGHRQAHKEKPAIYLKRSRAVSGLRNRSCDVNSAILRSTALTTPTFRTFPMVTRTTTTRTTSAVSAPFADLSAACHAPFSLSDLLQAYYDCRKHKRNTNTALAFEINLERNIVQLRDDLLDGSYMPGQSICFVVTRPKAREVWAADFRDRVVHHLLYNHISARFQNSFIADSCACIGTATTAVIAILHRTIGTGTISRMVSYRFMD